MSYFNQIILCSHNCKKLDGQYIVQNKMKMLNNYHLGFKKMKFLLVTCFFPPTFMFVCFFLFN